VEGPIPGSVISDSVGLTDESNQLGFHLYRTLVESSSELIALLDVEGRFVFANRASRQFLGFDPSELRGRQIHDVLGLEPGPGGTCPDATELCQRDMSHELQARSKAGETIDLRLSTVPIVDREANVQAVVAVLSDSSEAVATCRRFERLAHEDELTKLPNRRRFLAQLEGHLSERSPKGSGALLILDLDHFKEVNDRFGHPAGDAVLREVAIRLLERVRPPEYLARLQGDEFALLLPGADLERARVVAERLKASILSPPIKVARGSVALSACVGVATIEADRSIGEPMGRADASLHEAKRQAGGPRRRARG